MLPGLSELFFSTRSCPAESSLDEAALGLIVFQLLVDMAGDMVCGFMLSRRGIDVGRIQRMSSPTSTAADVLIAAVYGTMGLAMTDTCLFGGLFHDYKNGLLELQKFSMKIGPGGSESLNQFLLNVFVYAFAILLGLVILGCLTQHEDKHRGSKISGLQSADDGATGAKSSQLPDEAVPPDSHARLETQLAKSVDDMVGGMHSSSRPSTPKHGSSHGAHAVATSASHSLRARRWAIGTRSRIGQIASGAPNLNSRESDGHDEIKLEWGPEWVESWDESRNQKYWHNTETQASMWDTSSVESVPVVQP